MRRLLPSVAEETDPTRVYADLVLTGPVGDRSGVSLGMVSSVDGGASFSGRTADLGGAADRAAFGALRAAADAVVVGAGTVRIENYGPGVSPPARQRSRRAKGLSASPRLVVVSNRLELDPDARVFSDPDHPPLLVTTERGATRQPDVAARGELLVVGADEVDLVAALHALAGMGLERVLCEGGPRLNASLLADGLVDEVFLTFTPMMVGGHAPRIVASDAPEIAARLELVGLHEHDGELLLRYRTIGTGPADRL